MYFRRGWQPRLGSHRNGVRRSARPFGLSGLRSTDGAVHMSTAADRPEKVPPACPRCRMKKALLVMERFGTESYFCPQCEHSWDVQVREGSTKSTSQRFRS